ncbi:hypothetical protein E4L95_13520, partial [Paracoccus liaowanqingii]
MGKVRTRGWLAGLVAAAMTVSACAPMPAPQTGPASDPYGARSAPAPALPAPSAPHASTPDGAVRSFVQVMRR